MARYLLNQTDVYAVDSLPEVDSLKKELLEDNEFELTAFSYKVKEIKQKKEVVGTYYLASAKKTYLVEKELYS